MFIRFINLPVFEFCHKHLGCTLLPCYPSWGDLFWSYAVCSPAGSYLSAMDCVVCLVSRFGLAVSWGTSVRIRFGSPFSSKVVVCGHCLMTLSLTINETLKWLSSLPILMQVSFWWWQCSDRYTVSLFPPLPYPFTPFSPSLISLVVSVDVKHHVYLFTWSACRPVSPSTRWALVCRTRERWRASRPLRATSSPCPTTGSWSPTSTRCGARSKHVSHGTKPLSPTSPAETSTFVVICVVKSIKFVVICVVKTTKFVILCGVETSKFVIMCVVKHIKFVIMCR